MKKKKRMRLENCTTTIESEVNNEAIGTVVNWKRKWRTITKCNREKSGVQKCSGKFASETLKQSIDTLRTTHPCTHPYRSFCFALLFYLILQLTALILLKYSIHTLKRICFLLVFIVVTSVASLTSDSCKVLVAVLNLTLVWLLVLLMLVLL